jgi:PTS system ascorbate-specific IIB component
MGLGSGLLLRMQVEKVLKEANIPAKVEVMDISSARGSLLQADMVVTSSELAPQLGETKVPIITIHNFVDLNEMRSKVVPVAQSLHKG